MKTFTVIGNCQAPFVAESLLSNSTFASEFTYFRIPPVHVLDHSQIARYAEKLNEVDLIIHQPVVNKERFGGFEINELRQTLAGDRILICIPSLFFNGYFPTIGKIGELASPSGQVHDLAIFHGFRLGVPEERMAELAFETSVLSEKQLVNAWESGVRELENRERDFSTDISFSRILAEHGRTIPLMYQFNHPTQSAFDLLGCEVLKVMGIAGTCLSPNRLDAICWPVIPAVRKALGIGFSEFDKIVITGTAVSPVDYVRQAYGFYAASTPEDIARYAGRMQPVAERLAAVA